jgi:DNA-binding NarL/FixJ family response regulator
MSRKMEKTGILIADPQFLVRAGLRCIIMQSDDFIIVGEVTCVAEIPDAVAKLKPQIIITDHLAEAGAFGRMIDSVISANPHMKILIISDDSDTTSIFRVLEKGISGFLTRSCDAEEILDALKAARRGDKIFCTKVLDALLEKSLGKPATCHPTALSQREVEIVRLIAGGHVAREIADRLHLSTHTVYTHRKNIMRKLQLQTPTELMLYALSSGILESQPK